MRAWVDSATRQPPWASSGDVKKAWPLRLKRDVAEPLVHAKAGDHVARDVGGPRQIVCGTGRQFAKHQLLCGAPAQQYGDLVLEIGTRHQEPVLGGALQRVAQCADAARDDRDIVYGSVSGSASATSAWPIS